MRIVVEVPDELHAQFKQAVRESGATQAGLVRVWMEAYVASHTGSIRQAGIPTAPKRDLSKQAQAAGRSRR